MTHTSHTNSTSTRLYLNLSEINTACPILTLEKIFFEAYYIYYREKKIIIKKKIYYRALVAKVTGILPKY